MSEPIAWVVLFSVERKTYMMTTGRSVHGFESLNSALHYFESTYKEAHERSNERSMSAIMFWLSFKPVIVPLYREADLLEWVEKDENNLATNMSFYSLSGTMTGIKIEDNVVDSLMITSTEPNIAPVG